jgi:hypothetical protein
MRALSRRYEQRVRLLPVRRGSFDDTGRLVRWFGAIEELSLWLAARLEAIAPPGEVADAHRALVNGQRATADAAAYGQTAAQEEDTVAAMR